MAQPPNLAVPRNEPSDQVGVPRDVVLVRLGTLLIQTTGRIRKRKAFIQDSSPPTEERIEAA